MCRVRITIVAVEKHYVTYFECVFLALIIQHAKRMRRIILLSVTSLALPYFYTLTHEWHILGKKIIERKMCLYICTRIF
jgi:hypothetical protein